MVAIDRSIGETQRWAYPLLLVLSGVALGVSGLPAPLYGIYETNWHLSPLATTIVFAVYAVAALAAVLVSGRISDVVGRKPVLLGALVALLIGLGVFLIADSMAMLLLARAIHGVAVGSIVVAGAAALLDLRPDHGVRVGQLSGVAFNIGMTIAIFGSALLAQYAPHPLRTPYAVVAVICLIVGVGVLALREPHTARTRGPIRIARPAVPAEIRADFWFSALGAMASWSVLGVLLSLYPSLAAHHTHIDNLVFGGAVVATTAFAAALAQLAATRVPARYAAIIGDAGMAAALLLTIPVLLTHQWQLVFVAAALLGATFGLGFGGSLRHLSNVVPPARRGETMSAFYLLAYSAMAVPTLVAGWAATRWELASVFPWFAGIVSAACLGAAVAGLRSIRVARAA
ncbi:MULTISPECIES: MFS transporter [Mycolicibacterium]|uniref:Arabinose efflux permease family protein n=3 Tax=Mycolicibacterium gilvum TaxID=1804 RepID=E6THJ8_MYCSR|nr:MULTISPECIES: MFS transporter [Mycolicibacterium]ABP43932.1 major facilitator superfamily MFS_1 [Mycolicibacterium gilvum PYR-GCK]ADU01261.1 arabinose efflux permease family protein [Mycolicibacterium gilvum Spyr1]MBV5243800.1 MFS transporter [Mycolicibacterium sp. PAM1]MCV7054420.1 MFS transporter [Mycolicibacterium gilvum]STZ45772.1 major facilitator transporter [Mycolicibacterium gilvum]